MKKYRVTLVDFNGETNPEVMDLVNVNDPTDRIMCAPDEFNEGEIVDEGMFYTEEGSYVDEQGVGIGLFAFRDPQAEAYNENALSEDIPNTNFGVDGL